MISVFQIWTIFLILKLLLGLFLPLSFDETYYWVWSQNLSLGYFDHPPMVAYWLKLGEPLFGFFSGVRLPAIFLGHLSFLFWDKVLSAQISTHFRKLWMLLCGFSPLLGFGGVIVTPDLPLLLFWSAAVYYLWKILIGSNKLTDYILLGACLGLGFTSKYNIVIFIPAALLSLYLMRHEIQILWRGVALTIIFGFLFSSPPLVWNYLHDFESFRFQLSHGLEQKKEPLFFWTTPYLISQILLLFPLSIFYALKAKQAHFLMAFAWLPLIFFLLTSISGKVEANWPLVAYPAVLALALIGSSRVSWVRTYCSFWIAGLLVVCIHYFKPVLPLKELNTKINELRNIEYLRSIIESHQPIYASNYQVTSKIRYELGIEINKVTGVSRRDYFDSEPGSVPPKGPFYVIGLRSDSRFAMRRHYKYISKTPIDDRFAIFEMEKE